MCRLVFGRSRLKRLASLPRRLGMETRPCSSARHRRRPCGETIQRRCASFSAALRELSKPWRIEQPRRGAGRATSSLGFKPANSGEPAVGTGSAHCRCGKASLHSVKPRSRAGVESIGGAQEDRRLDHGGRIPWVGKLER